MSKRKIVITAATLCVLAAMSLTVFAFATNGESAEPADIDVISEENTEAAAEKDIADKPAKVVNGTEMTEDEIIAKLNDKVESGKMTREQADRKLEQFGITAE